MHPATWGCTVLPQKTTDFNNVHLLILNYIFWNNLSLTSLIGKQFFVEQEAKMFSEDIVCPREVGSSGEESLKSMISNDASQTKNGTFIDGNPLNRLDQHSTKKLLVETTDKPVSIPQKRSWKPYFLVNPEEGYDYCWIGSRKRANPRKIITEAPSIWTNPPYSCIT